MLETEFSTFNNIISTKLIAIQRFCLNGSNVCVLKKEFRTLFLPNEDVTITLNLYLIYFERELTICRKLLKLIAT